MHNNNSPSEVLYNFLKCLDPLNEERKSTIHLFSLIIMDYFELEHHPMIMLISIIGPRIIYKLITSINLKVPFYYFSLLSYLLPLS